MKLSKEIPGTPEGQEETRRLAAAYDWAKRNFTAEDLQRFTVEEEMFPFEQLIAELEAIQRGTEVNGAHS